MGTIEYRVLASAPAIRDLSDDGWLGLGLLFKQSNEAGSVCRSAQLSWKRGGDAGFV